MKNARTRRAVGAAAAILAAGAVTVTGHAGAQSQAGQTRTTPERIGTEQQLRENIEQAVALEQRLRVANLNAHPTGRVDAAGATGVC
jgi:hypothetical protein